MNTNKSSLYRYPGTKPFEASEYKLFKGRDEDIQNLYELISIQDLIVLYGRSGLGKSSLLNAGLINKFKAETTATPVFIRFGTYYSGSSETPLDKLNEIITREYKQNQESFIFQKLIAEEEVTIHRLWYLFKSIQIADPTRNTFILVFDQFEELFSYPPEQIEVFKKELSELFFLKVPQQLRNLLKDKLLLDSNYLKKEEIQLLFSSLTIKILFAIRSDKLELLNNLSDYFPAVLKHCYELKPLNKKQAQDAIQIPASLTDENYISPPFIYTPESLNLIFDSLTAVKKATAGIALKDNRQEIETFQLQIVCKYAENLIIEKEITEIKAEDLGNIKEIFENHYRNIIDKLSEESRLPARHLIEEKLIIDANRVSMPIPFILKDKGMSRQLLDELINTHILRADQNNTVEISHDTLIEPILKYYEERKKQEEIELEVQQKEEQLRKFKEEQEEILKEQQHKLEIQKYKSRRRTSNLIIIFLTISLFGLLTNYIFFKQRAEAIETAQFQTRRANHFDSVKTVLQDSLNIVAESARQTRTANLQLQVQRDSLDSVAQLRITEAMAQQLAVDSMKSTMDSLKVNLNDISTQYKTLRTSLTETYNTIKNINEAALKKTSQLIRRLNANNKDSITTIILGNYSSRDAAIKNLDQDVTDSAFAVLRPSLVLIKSGGRYYTAIITNDSTDLVFDFRNYIRNMIDSDSDLDNFNKKFSIKIFGKLLSEQSIPFKNDELRALEVVSK